MYNMYILHIIYIIYIIFIILYIEREVERGGMGIPLVKTNYFPN